MPRTPWAVLALLAAAALAQAQELTPGTEYRVDAPRSEIAWEVGASLKPVRSRTRDLSGTARIVSVGEDGAVLEGRLEITAGSFDTGSARRDRTLRENSLAVEDHPKIVFEPKRMYRISSWAEDEVLAIEGDLSIRGVTRAVQIPVSLSWRGQRVILDGVARLPWSDYGIPDPSSFLMKVRPEVLVVAHLELVARP